jgi:hypothetical protein
VIDLRRLLQGRQRDADKAFGALSVLGIVPAELHEALRVRKAVRGARNMAPGPKAPPTPGQFADRIIAAAVAGDPLPEGFGVDPEAYPRIRGFEEATWDIAVNQVVARFDATVASVARAVYAGPLRQLLAEALESVRAGANPMTVAEFYVQVRVAQIELRPYIGPPKIDSSELLAEVRNVEVLAGPAAWVSQRSSLDWSIGPKEPAARMAWLASPEVETWLPLPEEQDKAFVDGHNEAINAEAQALYDRRADAASKGQTLEVHGLTEAQWQRQRQLDMVNAPHNLVGGVPRE